MSGHVHLLYADQTLGATLQRQLQAAHFHVTASADDDPVACLRDEGSGEVIALVRGPRTRLETVRQLKQAFPHRPVVVLDPLASEAASAAALREGADASIPLPQPVDALALRLQTHVRQARRLTDAAENDAVLSLLGVAPVQGQGAADVALAVPLETRLDVRHEDPQTAAQIVALLGKAGLVAEVQPLGLQGRPIATDALIIGAVSEAGWTDVLALIARERGRTRTRNTPILIAAPSLPPAACAGLARADVQDIWLGSAPNASLVLMVQARVRAHQQTARRHAALTQSLDLAITDGLTGLFNRRFLMAHLPMQMQAARQDGQPLSLALIDLDGFKGLNDRRGHQAGDQFLIGVAEHLRRNSRESDSAVRLGGDEFALVLPRTAREAAHGVLQRLIDAIAGLPLASEALASKGAQPAVSASAGIVTLSPDNWTMTAESLLAQADARLYAAKEKGGNQIMDAAPS